MDFVSRYIAVPKKNHGESFVGINSGNGFVGCYNDIINESDLKRLYVIKGAAGTGKSTFMRELAKEAEQVGFNVKRYMCSSDHNSLDAVTVNDSVAVIDGTAPHSYETKYPGAVSEILDYTKFWDNGKLTKERDSIIKCSDIKSTAYEEVYSHLKYEMNIRYDCYKSISTAIEREKMLSQISRSVTALAGKCEKGLSKRLITHSVGMHGRFRIAHDTSEFSNIIKISDVYGSAYVYMSEFANLLKKNNIVHIISPDPVCPELICEIILPVANILITIEESESFDKIVNMSRFLNNERLSKIRGFLRLSEKCCDLFAKEADRYLGIAGKAHFELEKIYGNAMNFDFLKTYSEIKIKEIIEYAKL